MANRLSEEVSPYLLQHAHNPVNWYPWGEEAFSTAREESKPVFLSIGYSTCHWCHVMERESFESEEVAAVLNRDFISIKVDREERPDVDHLYMNAVQAMTGQGGWPLSVWLTPDLKPFFGGTYFPPESRMGRPGLVEILEKIADTWKEKQVELEASGEKLVSALSEAAEDQGSVIRPSAFEEMMERGENRLAGQFDRENGGFGGAPKFPRPSTPLFLLRQSDATGDIELRNMVRQTALSMARGGIHDHVGGGFHRYSVDAEWLVPHFEKMLYDQALLLWLYAEVYEMTREAWAAGVLKGLRLYLQEDMRHPQGAFYSAEDADSEGREGLFYVWTHEELSRLLPEEEMEAVVEGLGISRPGNFFDHSDPEPLKGLNVLYLQRDELITGKSGLLKSALKKMKLQRAGRQRPLRDEKVLTGWNALAISAFFRAYQATLDEAFQEDALAAMSFIESELVDYDAGTIRHQICEGRKSELLLMQDYAAWLDALVSAYESTLETSYLLRARGVASAMIERFYDREAGGFWQRAENQTDLVMRLKDDYDGAEPSGNSLAAYALARLGTILLDEELLAVARKTVEFQRPILERMPEALPHMLLAVDFLERSPLQLVIAGERDDPAMWEFWKAAMSVYHPRKVVIRAESSYPSPFIVDMAKGAEDEVMAYLCEGGVCQVPVNSAGELKQQLSRLD